MDMNRGSVCRYIFSSSMYRSGFCVMTCDWKKYIPL